MRATLAALVALLCVAHAAGVSLSVNVDAKVETITIDDARESPESAAREFAVLRRLTRTDSTKAIAGSLREKQRLQGPTTRSPLLAIVRARDAAPRDGERPSA